MEFNREEKLKILNKILDWSVRKRGCLVCYLGIQGGTGRPRIEINDKQYLVSRLMMHLVKDFDLESDMFILHDNTCTTKCCIDVDHLRPGTASDNAQDFLKKHGHNQVRNKKSHCKRGHARVEENLTMQGTCKLCQKLWYERKKRRELINAGC